MNAGGQRFVVRIAPSGRAIEVRADQPILEAALRSGLNLPHSCRAGHCGSCRARLLDGEIAYARGLPAGLSEGEARDGYVLLCQACPRSDLAIETRPVSRAAEMEIKSLPCRIERKKALAPDVLQVLLRLPAAERLEFEPGQYLDVLLGDGRRRSFSIACPPHDSGLLELHVRRVPGGRFTSRLFEALDAGSLLRVEGPLGQFACRNGESPLVLVAGGTGFAPLKSMLRHVLERGTGRRVHLLWGGRQAADLYEEALVLDWAHRHPAFTFTAALSEATHAGAAHRELGCVTDVLFAHYPRFALEEVYAAGPPSMIETLRAALSDRGPDPDRFHFESFDFASDGGA